MCRERRRSEGGKRGRNRKRNFLHDNHRDVSYRMNVPRACCYKRGENTITVAAIAFQRRRSTSLIHKHVPYELHMSLVFCPYSPGVQPAKERGKYKSRGAGRGTEQKMSHGEAFDFSRSDLTCATRRGLSRGSATKRGEKQLPLYRKKLSSSNDNSE